MNTTYTLTADEILYLAAQEGADSFYGVEDNLSGLPIKKLQERVIEIQDKLSERGYMQLDFDGNQTVDNELTEMIVKSSRPDSFLCLEYEKCGETQKGIWYFRSRHEIIRMSLSEQEYYFEYLTAAVLENEVREKLGLSGVENHSVDAAAQTYRIKQKELVAIRKLIDRGAAESAADKFINQKFPEELANQIIEGMQHKMDFYSLMFFDETSPYSDNEELVFLRGQHFILLENVVEEDVDMVQFRVVPMDILQEKLDKGLALLGIGEAEEVNAFV